MRFKRNPFVAGNVVRERGGAFGYWGRDIYGKIYRSPVTFKTDTEAREALMRRMFKRNPSRGGSPDPEAARELVLFATNDGQLYRSQTQSIIKNLARKVVKGTYRPDMAVKLWKYLADNAARKYAKENAQPGEWSDIFSVPTRLLAAKMFVAEYDEELRHAVSGLGYKKNPSRSRRRYRRNPSSKSVGWNVYLNGKLIDTVFFTGYTAEEVYKSLVNHDGYDPRITVRKSKYRG